MNNQSDFSHFFDLFVGIDWSGAKHPVRSRSISLSWCEKGQNAPEFIESPLSRCDIAEWIIQQSLHQKKIFIGIDCNLGYASSVLMRQFGASARAMQLWDRVESINAHQDNFNADLFWKHPEYVDFFWQEGKKPDWYNQEVLRRLTERACIQQEFGNPECPFKLIGPKQVGKGGLSGMRLAKFLSEQLRDRLCIWPFNPITDKTDIIVSEIFPRLFWKVSGVGNKKIRDFNVLNKGLHFFQSETLSTKIINNQSITDHQADSVIIAAGLRHFIQSGYATQHKLLLIPTKYEDIIKAEGWIFGVKTMRAEIED